MVNVRGSSRNTCIVENSFASHHAYFFHAHVFTIALFTVNFSHLHYNVFERGCEAISGNFGVSARNRLTSTFKYIVMQMSKVNREKGY